MAFDIKPGAVIRGDCLTVLRQMEPDSVDMVITDPPYGVDYQSNRPKSKDPSARFEKIANDKTPFIWWIYDAYRVLKEGTEKLPFFKIVPSYCTKKIWFYHLYRFLKTKLSRFGAV